MTGEGETQYPSTPFSGEAAPVYSVVGLTSGTVAYNLAGMTAQEAGLGERACYS